MLHAPGDAAVAVEPVLDSLVCFVAGKLAAVKRELFLGDRQGRRRGLEVGEEELEESKIAQLGRMPGRMAEPRSKRLSARVGDREEASPAPANLAVFGEEAEVRQSRRFLVQERVGERPEMADRRRDVPLWRWAARLRCVVRDSRVVGLSTSLAATSIPNAQRPIPSHSQLPNSKRSQGR